MDAVLQRIINKLDAYIGGLIDEAAMSETDKADLKGHLLAAQDILIRSGNEKLQQVIGGVTGVILSKLS